MGPDVTETDDITDIHDLWRVWVTPSDRKRCTYVTRDEQPVAAVTGGDNRLVRF